MIEKIVKSVTISCSAYMQIQKSVQNAVNRYEVGGVLLGRKKYDSYYIDAVTADRGKSTAMTTFILNGKVHSQMAQKIIDNETEEIELLGVWHSHICDFGNFSVQDKQANKALSSMLGGALSILATMHNSDIVNLHTYYIAKNNTEHYQTITIR